LRAILGVESPRDFRLPDVRSMVGCILLIGFVLYPYVYLTARAMFLMQAANLIDTARTLGASRTGVFFRVALPLARPAIAIGLSLVLMEALNDIGASEFLGVRTLTVSVYTTWVTRSDLPGAAQIALAMLAVVVGLVVFERWARRQRRYANDAQSPRPLIPHRLRGMRGLFAFVTGAVPVTLGFAIPAAYLTHAAFARVRFAGVSGAVLRETMNTVWLSLVATALTLLGGIVVSTQAAYTAASGLASLRVSCRSAMPFPGPCSRSACSRWSRTPTAWSTPSLLPSSGPPPACCS
jgi:iron(III) transport system permease protein